MSDLDNMAAVLVDDELINAIAAGQPVTRDVGTLLSAWHEELVEATPLFTAEPTSRRLPRRRRPMRVAVGSLAAAVVLAGGGVAAAAASTSGPLAGLHRVLFGTPARHDPTPTPTTVPSTVESVVPSSRNTPPAAPTHKPRVRKPAVVITPPPSTGPGSGYGQAPVATHAPRPQATPPAQRPAPTSEHEDSPSNGDSATPSSDSSED